MTYGFSEKKRPFSRLIYINIVVLILSLGLMLTGVLGYRYEIIDLKTSLLVLTKYGVYGCVILVCLSFMSLGVLIRRNITFIAFNLLVFIALVSIYFVYTFYNYKIMLYSNPLINDVSTDYTSLLKYNTREEDTNNSYEKNSALLSFLQNYGGFSQPYKNVNSVLFDKNEDLIFEKSIEVINAMGMKIVFFDKENGIIEATDTSFWYGFVDDFIVRIDNMTSGAKKVDARSASRVGKSDLGVNAKRIKTFMELLKESLIS